MTKTPLVTQFATKTVNYSRIFNLLSVGADAKTRKGESAGYLTGILYLAPSDLSGVINVCPNASAGCRAACLWTSGMGKFPNVKLARTNRTKLFKTNRPEFLKQIRNDVALLKAIATSKGMLSACRINGTSDLPWEKFDIIQQFPDVPFYDYTKSESRMNRYLKGEMPANYHLTFSRSESNHAAVERVIKKGGNVAVVFSGELPKKYMGRPVVSGDENDLRFLDARGVIVGLSAKGMAKRDASGFVI
jgi:hypothetical protein